LLDGVDLNRNYGVEWGYDELGSSSFSWHPWYRGDSAFSEPETQAMKLLLQQHNFKSAINWHAWGNYLIYPWNYKNYYTDDSVSFEAFCKQMAYENNYVYGTCYETYGYQSNGDADDWAYGINPGDPHILSITAETGNASDGFWPTQSRIIELCKEALPNDLTFLRLNLHYAKIHDLSSSVLISSADYLHYRIQNLGIDTPSTFTVQFTSLTPGFTIDPAPRQYNALQKLQEVADSVYYNISLPGSAELEYIISVDNGSYAYTDTIKKYYDPAALYFYNDCSDMSHFSGSDWGLANNQYYSFPSSITESPGGNYSIFQQSELTLDSVIDLTTAEYAAVNFYAKWDLENNYDYVQLLISTDNGVSWSPLCGKYSEIASSDEPAGEPVWDAIQNDWIMEDVSLNDYIGMTAKLKFSFLSDQSGTRDGFYFDDLSVYVVQNTLYSGFVAIKPDITIEPNPVRDFLYLHSESKENLNVLLTDIYGNMVRQTNFVFSGMIYMKDLSAGIYILKVYGSRGVNQKMVVKI
jgi:carboxypeptidase T